MNADFIISELLSVADAKKAAFLQRYFKTGKGQYAENDVFLGIAMPFIRNIVNHCPSLSFDEILKLLQSELHEVRMAGFLLLNRQFKKTKTEVERKEIYEFYLKNARRANNWDLVDISCREITGAYLLNKSDRSVLYRLAVSDNLWEQRIAIVSTWTFIKYLQFNDTIQLSEKLLHHPHDLINKATGWMLREVGKKDCDTLRRFLTEYHSVMPRITLRYSIEHFDAAERQKWMQRATKIS